MDFKKIGNMIKDVVVTAWIVGVPIVQKKYPLETQVAMAALEEMKDLRKRRAKNAM